MNRCSLLYALAAAPMVGGCVESSQCCDDSKPNVVLVVADDHGMDALGCYGNPVIKTPNLDALAERGVRFSNAYCTSASSAASRSVILTGRYGHSIGAYGHTHDYHHFSTFDGVRSLPVILAENGYHTARIGKYHVAPESVYHFDITYEADPRNTVEMAESCKGVFESESPFFLYFCTDDPHRGEPFKPEKWSDPNAFGNLPEGYEGVDEVIYDPKDVLVPSFLPDTKESREEIAQYYQSVSRIDQGFGRLMEHLKASGKMDNTIVIYISDNGMAFPGAKTTLYDPGMNLPCLISAPSIDAQSTTCDAMITWADLTPTILDFAGVDWQSEKMAGRSFKDVIKDEHPEGWDEIFAAHNFHEVTMYYPMRVIRNREYKLIWNVAWQLEYPFASDLWVASTWQRNWRDKEKIYGKRKVTEFMQRPRFELYNVANDPDEVHNLAQDRRYAKVLEQMQATMYDKIIETRDPWLVCWGDDHDSSMQSQNVNL